MFRTENELVHWLQSWAVSRERGDDRAARLAGRVKLGIGDDAALVDVRNGCELILTTDMSVENVHFTRELHKARAVGHRALARSLSDVAAMGGVPRYALVSLAITKQTRRAWISGFYGGLQALARRFGVHLIGGDTAVVPGAIFIDVLVAGEVRRGKALRRSGADAGDLIFVSGRLGMSALGLRVLRSRFPKASPPAPKPAGLHGQAREKVPASIARGAVQAHLYPEPRCVLGQFLSSRGLASALIDVSDGLSTDLDRLCAASGVGARLWAAKIPSPALPNAADSLQLALDGGEDYQLLFTVPQRAVSRLPSRSRGQPLYQIGEIEATSGVRLVTPEGKVLSLAPGGWDHFRSGSGRR
jgi:thiamine-monophosphate kinase